jgi:peptidoglycan hydrolase-like amidase
MSDEAEWWKAEITDYDSSLSLISYELTPGVSQNNTEETDEKDAEKTTESEKAEEKTESEAATQASTSADSTESSDSNTQTTEDSSTVESVTPTYVESQTSGGTVVEMPAAQTTPEINAQSGQFAFTTYGWGHGVGMSQNGANFYAMYSGWSYQDILYHYYPGTYLMNTGTAGSEIVSAGGTSGDVLTIVAGIVNREMGSGMSTEAIKAQAVAVYTYIKYYGGDANDLRMQADPPQSVIDACASVLGEALYYDGNYALTMFYASSGGTTANCYEVFTDDIPYLRSVSSDYDSAYDPHYGTIVYSDASYVQGVIASCYGVSLSGDPSSWFQVITGDSGYVTQVVIGGQVTVSGTDFQSCLGLKSSKFNITYTA